MITFGIGSSIGGCFVADPPKIWEKMDGFVVAAAADRSFKAGNDCAKEEEVFKPRRKTFRLLIVCVMIVMIGKRVSVRKKNTDKTKIRLFLVLT